MGINVLGLAFLLLLLVLVNCVFALKSICYRYSYKNKLSKFDFSWKPLAAVFVPCKGIEEGMEKYLRAMLTQNYPNYRVYFVVESESDPAFEFVKKLSLEYEHSCVTVAGRTEKCCQKNHNLLAGINIELQREDKAEVFIFADADVKPSASWMQDLILPMSDKNISATTAYRWLKPRKFSFWGTMHAMLSAYLGTLMSSSKGMWGGSMAIKTNEFIKYGVKERWETAVGDDIPLMEIIIKNKLNRVFVPICTAESVNVIDKFKPLFAWFVRQNQYLKIYCNNLWLTAYVLTVSNSLTVVLVPFVLLFLLLFTQKDSASAIISARMLFVYILLAYMILMLFVMALSRFEGKEGQSYLVWVLMAYPSMVMGVATMIASGFQSDLIWRGIRYGVNKDGSVSFVKVENERG